jgi:broad specificity phosphatase PhoE
LRESKKTGGLEKDPTAEHTKEYIERVLGAWSELMAEPALVDGAKALLVSHGGWISALIDVLHNTGRLDIPEGVAITRCFNVSVSIIELDLTSKKGTLIQYANIDHLKELTEDFVQDNADI